MSDLRSVILVEDDRDIAVLATISLGEIGGMHVRHYASGTALLDDLDAPMPDLFLLDYRLADLTGEELLYMLRADPRSKAVPAVFITASLMEERVRSLMKAGAIGVIGKPFDPLTLADRLRECWEKAQRA